MQDLSLHILDIAENAIRANAKEVIIKVFEDDKHDRLTVSIEDDGDGMDDATIARVLDPFFTTKSGKKVGLGISLLCQAAEQTEGDLTIKSEKDRGTTVTAVFNASHPDMKPMGSIPDTLAVLITGNPEVRFVCDYERGDDKFYFDSMK